jgi:hypothetical protein
MRVNHELKRGATMLPAARSRHEPIIPALGTLGIQIKTTSRMNKYPGQSPPS